MIKFRLYFDKDAETEWLNEMSAKGWAMTRFFAGFYTFEKCECGKYIYQVDFGNKLFSVRKDYREFMQEAGVEIVQAWGFWIILRKLAADGEFQLYTDVESSIEHYSKIRKMFKIVTIIEIILLWIEIMAAVIGDNPYGLPVICFMGAVVIVFVRMVYKTTHTINKLKERQTGIMVEKQRNVSILISIGLLFNACALGLQDLISVYLKNTIQIIAIVLMLVGIWKTARNRKK